MLKQEKALHWISKSILLLILGVGLVSGARADSSQDKEKMKLLENLFFQELSNVLDISKEKKDRVIEVLRSTNTSKLVAREQAQKAVTDLETLDHKNTKQLNDVLARYDSSIKKIESSSTDEIKKLRGILTPSEYADFLMERRKTYIKFRSTLGVPVGNL